MCEHYIRLRGGWEYMDLGDADGGSRRVDLPVAIDWMSGRRIRLVRRFGRPGTNPDRESTVLRFETVPGLTSALLNGRPLAVATALGQPVEVDMTGLPYRNVLILEVAAPPSLLQAKTDMDPIGWGEIALVIRARRD